MALTIQREELTPLHKEWAALLDQVPEPVPFVHPTWQRVWLEEFQGDRELLLYTARDGDSLVGVAPLLRENGRLSLVGHYSMCDYMDFVVAPDRTGDFYPAILEALLEEPWSELELRGLREGSPTLAALPDLVRAAGLGFEQEEEAVAPRVHPAASWEEQVASLSKKNRHELRRKLRRLEGAGTLELQVYTTREDVEAHLPTLLRFMVESRRDKAQFMSEQMGRFFHRMSSALAEDGLIRLYELQLNGKPVASILCFDQCRQLFMYNSGYDPEYAGLSVGLGSKALCLRDSIEAGYQCMDFLRGDEPYKYDLGGTALQIYKCMVRRP